MTAVDVEPASTRWVVLVISGLVVLAVAAVLGASAGHAEPVTTPAALATVNAVLNGAAASCLVLGYWAIRRRRVGLHRICMLTGFCLSTAFLVTYLVHHARAGSVAFTGTGWLRIVYLAVLVPHILLAVVILPMALLTVYRAWTGRFALHRRIARWTLPVWLYVSVSGVLVYWMLYHL